MSASAKIPGPRTLFQAPSPKNFLKARAEPQLTPRSRKPMKPPLTSHPSSPEWLVIGNVVNVQGTLDQCPGSPRDPYLVAFAADNQATVSANCGTLTRNVGKVHRVDQGQPACESRVEAPADWVLDHRSSNRIERSNLQFSVSSHGRDADVLVDGSASQLKTRRHLCPRSRAAVKQLNPLTAARPSDQMPRATFSESCRTSMRRGFAASATGIVSVKTPSW